MLKGHAKIELTDINTGKTETIEHNNMITNAVSNIANELKMIYGKDRLNKEIFPLSSKGMGGIMLFESPLNEDVNNMYMPVPSESNLTGYANAEANNTEDTGRGSKNLTESTQLTNGYKYVWDFTTSQGNGTISALALTNNIAGLQPWSCAEADEYNNTEIDFTLQSLTSVPEEKQKFAHACENIIKYDSEKNIAFSVRTISTTEYEVIKLKFSDKVIGMNENLCDLSIISDEIIDISDTEITLNYEVSGANYNSDLWIDGGDQYIYGFYTNSMKNGIYIVRFNYDTLKIDEQFGKKQLKIPTATTATAIKILYNKNYFTYSKYKYLTALNGYIYINDINNNLCKVNINNMEDIETKEIPTFATNEFFYNNRNMILNDKIAIFENLDYVNKTTIQGAYTYTSNAIDIIFDKNIALIIVSSNLKVELRFRSVKNYLATINNLDTPVEKTADKTMKITYTITASEN